MRIIISILLSIIGLCYSCKSESEKVSSTTDTSTSILEPDTSEDFQLGEEEVFKSVDASFLNSRLATMKEKISVGEVAELLFLPGSFKGNENIAVKYDKLPNGDIKAVVIHDYLSNEHTSAEKFVFVIHPKDEKWEILTLDKNWKCSGRDTWGIIPCS